MCSLFCLISPLVKTLSGERGMPYFALPERVLTIEQIGATFHCANGFTKSFCFVYLSSTYSIVFYLLAIGNTEEVIRSKDLSSSFESSMFRPGDFLGVCHFYVTFHADLAFRRLSEVSLLLSPHKVDALPPCSFPIYSRVSPLMRFKATSQLLWQISSASCRLIFKVIAGLCTQQPSLIIIVSSQAETYFLALCS